MDGPFAFPDFSEEDDQGFQTVTYPVRNTEGMFPHLDDNYVSHKVKKEKPPSMQPANLLTTDPDEQTRKKTPVPVKRVAEKEPRDGIKKKRDRKN